MNACLHACLYTTCVLACMHVCTPHACSASGIQERASYPRNWITDAFQVLWVHWELNWVPQKSSSCFSLLSSLSRRLHTDFKMKGNTFLDLLEKTPTAYSFQGCPTFWQWSDTVVYTNVLGCIHSSPVICTAHRWQVDMPGWANLNRLKLTINFLSAGAVCWRTWGIRVRTGFGWRSTMKYWHCLWLGRRLAPSRSAHLLEDSGT